MSGDTVQELTELIEEMRFCAKSWHDYSEAQKGFNTCIALTEIRQDRAAKAKTVDGESERARIESLAACWEAQAKRPIRDRIASLLRQADQKEAVDSVFAEAGDPSVGYCGGQTSEPPCGGCAGCLVAQALHYLPSWEQYLAVADRALATDAAAPPTDLATTKTAGDRPTYADVQRDPEYWIGGPGHEVASRTNCPHGYRLTDTCPMCDGASSKPDRLAAERALAEKVIDVGDWSALSRDELVRWLTRLRW
jgi:hypothetical protein